MLPPTQYLYGFWEFKLRSSYLYSKILTSEPAPQPLGGPVQEQANSSRQVEKGQGFFFLCHEELQQLCCRVLNAPLSTANHRAIFLDNISTIHRTPESLARYWSLQLCTGVASSQSMSKKFLLTVCNKDRFVSQRTQHCHPATLPRSLETLFPRLTATSLTPPPHPAPGTDQNHPLGIYWPSCENSPTEDLGCTWTTPKYFYRRKTNCSVERGEWD